MKTLDELKTWRRASKEELDIINKEGFEIDFEIDFDEDELSIEDQIADINNKLIELDEEKGRLITLQTDLEMKKRSEESNAYGERLKKARGRQHRQTEGRVGAKFSLLNKVKETRRARAERLRNKND